MKKEEHMGQIFVEDEYYDVSGGAKPVDGFVITRFEYLKGVKCHKLLWALLKETQKIAPSYNWSRGLPYDQEAVRELAQALCPSIVSWRTEDDLIKLLNDRTPIFKGFVGNDAISATVDILRPANDSRWDIVQISLTTAQSLDISEKWRRHERRRHVHDIAFQRHCCEKAGIVVENCYLAHVDGSYLRKGTLDSKILKISDLTREVEVELSNVAPRIDMLLKVAGMAECPPFNMFEGEADCLSHSHLTGWHCPLINECRESVNEPRAPLPKLDADDFDVTAARDILERITYPLHILEMKCLRRAIPIEGGQPYALSPFALSLLSLTDLDSEPRSQSWVWDGKGDACEQMLDRIREASGASGSILCEFGKSAIDEIMEIAERYPEQLSMIKSLTSHAFEISQTIKREKSGELALNGVYYLDSVFPESCKGVSPDDGQIEEWLFIQSIYGNSFLDLEEVQLTINKSGTRRTRRVLEYLRKMREVCYSA